MSPVFHLPWSTCRATKIFVTGWRKLLRKVERGLLWATNFGFVARFSSNSQLVAQQICSWHRKSINQRAAFLQPATSVFIAGQVDRARWKTGNTKENLKRNNVVRQVEGFYISYFAVFKNDLSATKTKPTNGLLTDRLTVDLTLTNNRQISNRPIWPTKDGLKPTNDCWQT